MNICITLSGMVVWGAKKMIGIVVALMLSIQSLGFAGGGGSSSDYGSDGWSSSDSGGWSSSDSGGWGSGSDSSSLGEYGEDIHSIASTLVIIAVLVAVLIIFHTSPKKGNRTSIAKGAERAKLSEAVSKMDQNSTELERWAHKEAERIFVAYQKDWSDFNTESIRMYTTDSYYRHACLMLEALKRMGRQNKVSGLQVIKVSLLSTLDGSEALPTSITVQFKFSGLDALVEIATGKTLYSDHVYGIYELWKFVYDGKCLRLDGISQPTKSQEHLVANMEQFARENDMFYSPDWGRYALPMRGAIFSGANFNFSDVNNHAIGKWGDTLVQLYTYAMSPSMPGSYYLVGQITVPKTYDRILIKSRFLNNTSCTVPEGCEEVSMEWGEFNERYQVFTSSKDALSAFELLNPSFMANLYDKDLRYNLEVVDNVIYIFTNIKSTDAGDYKKLLDILGLTYKELKL